MTRMNASTASAAKTSPRTVNFTATVNKAWNIQSQDGIELKTYIEMGFCEGMNAPSIINKYPQFNGYCRKTIYNTVCRLRKKSAENLDSRKGLKDGSKYSFDIL